MQIPRMMFYLFSKNSLLNLRVKSSFFHHWQSCIWQANSSKSSVGSLSVARGNYLSTSGIEDAVSIYCGGALADAEEFGGGGGEIRKRGRGRSGDTGGSRRDRRNMRGSWECWGCCCSRRRRSMPGRGLRGGCWRGSRGTDCACFCAGGWFQGWGRIGNSSDNSYYKLQLYDLLMVLFFPKSKIFRGYLCPKNDGVDVM